MRVHSWFGADLERVPWRENLMVGRTLFGIPSVKFILIATLKAEEKKKRKVFTSSNLLVPAERSGCCIWDISGTWWHLAVGRQNWQGKAFCLNWCVTTETVDWSDMQNLSWAAFWAGASRLPRVTDATKRGLGPLRQRSWKGATQGSAEKWLGLGLCCQWEW